MNKLMIGSPNGAEGEGEGVKKMRVLEIILI
jgi:hypothetical protein